MNFKKYSSIENSYQQKNILKFLERNPEAFKQRWIVRSKLDGANIQLVFTPFEPMKVGKRTGYIEEGTAFFDIWNTLKTYDQFFTALQDYCNELNTTLRLYGELYGPGIQKRVNYGDTKKIAVFDLEQGGILMPQFALISFLEGFQMSGILPPLIGIFDTFEEALNVNPEYDSKILGIPNNLEEGVVIQPYEENIYDRRDRFILKKKCDKFLEMDDLNRENHKNRKSIPINTELLEKVSAFKSYINENRVLSVFSKRGPIDNNTQIGDYIRWVLEDAIEDFHKDLPDLVITPDEYKTVFNVGKQILELLKKHL